MVFYIEAFCELIPRLGRIPTSSVIFTMMLVFTVLFFMQSPPYSARFHQFLCRIFGRLYEQVRTCVSKKAYIRESSHIESVRLSDE